MSGTVHLIVQVGNDRGKEVSATVEGVRIGRASKNDVVLSDGIASRHHCRVFLKPGDGLWVTDLGSANGTLVNNREVLESPLRTGDLVTVGDTILKVIADERRPEPAAPGRAALTFLGPGRGPLLLLCGLVAVMLAAFSLPRLLERSSRARRVRRSALPPVEIHYEKVRANSNNIFRFELVISPDNTLSVRAHDLVSGLPVEEKRSLHAEQVQEIGRFAEEAGFFALDDEYRGIPTDIERSREITVTIGCKTHRSRVTNRAEPEAFRRVRERVEECAGRETGLRAAP
jgi:hypothetical protein